MSPTLRANYQRRTFAILARKLADQMDKFEDDYRDNLKYCSGGELSVATHELRKDADLWEKKNKPMSDGED